ncbi:MAG: ribonuclease HII [Hydrogenophilus sp.]|nr:ribonuclease HII [Hydrogenophilus sp.]
MREEKEMQRRRAARQREGTQRGREAPREGGEELRRDPWVVGVDEAGRGPWAGPVVAAAVVLGERGVEIEGLADSKRLTAGQREGLFQAIKAQAVVWTVGWAEVEEIDKVGIRGATEAAMVRAVAAVWEKMVGRPERVWVEAAGVWVDGKELPRWPYPSRAIVRGDATVAAIAAASIVAKVVRDQYMTALEERFPGYGFAGHKGYGTAEHRAALNRWGPTAAHRRSFAPVAQFLLNSCKRERSAGEERENDMMVT